eukprot:CAMPEP_0204553556 /NCGR_PEP_ID=MMETSP0661-20131031/27460_1 /ASSEMBLY_ACC=CAM_ASM_000606 /TAXON_ID=109239 /ORGANISM="Alexandrium margalefi, Strain AMGDE01CS-322" /LENGTH=41 /DNA_ID= /DNA_START= /DNA_END= /DNA_ORIENTATION=
MVECLPSSLEQKHEILRTTAAAAATAGAQEAFEADTAAAFG